MKEQSNEYIEREMSLFLSQTDSGKGSLVIGGVILFLFGVIYYSFFLRSIPGTAEYIFISCYTIVFFILGYSAFKTAKKIDARPKFPKIYSPQKIFIKRRNNAIGFILFCGLVFGPWIIYSPLKIKLAASLFYVGIIGWCLYRLWIYQREYSNGKEYGDSGIEVENEPIKKGEEVVIYFRNKKIFTKEEELHIHLRNIKEIWEDKTTIDYHNEDIKRNYKIRKSILLYEEFKIIKIKDTHVKFMFKIPLDNVLSTNYAMNSPHYWELEVRTKTGYYSRFFIDVI